MVDPARTNKKRKQIDETAAAAEEEEEKRLKIQTKKLNIFIY